MPNHPLIYAHHPGQPPFPWRGALSDLGGLAATLSIFALVGAAYGVL